MPFVLILPHDKWIYHYLTLCVYNACLLALMLLPAVFNAVCLYDAFYAIDFFKCFLFSCFVLDY